MPTFAGNFITEDTVVFDPNASVNVTLARIFVGSPAQNAYETDFTLSAGVTATPYPGPYVAPPVAGTLLKDFIDDWYYRIHIIPGVLDLGNLVSDQGRPLQLWNAFFTAVDFEAFSTIGLDGISVTQPGGVTPPAVLPALSLLDYDVTVSLSGPPTIAARLIWTIEGLEYSVSITGRRVVPFPFPPNWSSPLNETLQFRSTLIKSHDGSVQTANIRRKARRIFDYNIQLTGAEAQRAENLLFGWQHRFYAMPVWAEGSQLAADAPLGATVIEVDTSDRSFSVGGLLALYGSSARLEVREVSAIDGTAVTLSSPTSFAWDAGTRVFPVFVSAINPSISGSRLTDNVLQMPVRFTAEPSAAVSNASGVAAATYRGFELSLERPNWVAGLGMAWNSDADMVDLGGPTFALAGRSGFPEVRRDHNWWKRGYAEIAEFRGWLQRRAGQAVPFYMPTGVDDFRLVDDVLATDTSIDVAANDYETVVAGHPARRDILIQYRDGTYLALRISSAAATEAGNTRLVFGDAIGKSFTPSDVLRISYLSLYRLASNDIVLSWLTNQFVVVNATLVNNRTTE